MSEPSSGTASGSRRTRRLRLLPAAVPLVALLLAAAGCGAAAPSPSPSPSLPADTASATATATPTPDPTAAAVIYGYDQAQATWVAAGANPSVEDAGLTQWYAGTAYSQVIGRLGAMVYIGVVLKGSYQPHPRVTVIEGTTATVHDCGYDTTYYVDKTTGATPSPQPFGGTVAPAWDSVTATMTQDKSGTWQLTNEQEEMGACTPGSP